MEPDGLLQQVEKERKQNVNKVYSKSKLFASSNEFKKQRRYQASNQFVNNESVIVKNKVH